MHPLRSIKIIVSIVVCLLLQAEGDKFTDENRPYEFGFKVDGQQHRHEKKDKDGIIMGEFGFVTADDVYHVTVYATDKDGHFKILSMKNIHLKSAPESSAKSERQGHSLALSPAPSNTLAPPHGPVPNPQKPIESVSLEPPGKSCSSCSIPTTPRPAPPPALTVNNQANNYNSPAQFGAPQNQQGFVPGQQNYQQQENNSGFGGQNNNAQRYNSVPQQGPSEQSYPQQYGGQQNYAGQGSSLGGAGNSAQGSETQTNDAQGGVTGGQNYPQEGSGSYPNNQNGLTNYPETQNNFGGSQQGQGGSEYPSAHYPANQGPASSAGRSPKQYNGPEQQFNPSVEPNYPGQQTSVAPKPTLLSAQMQIVDKNTDIHRLNPGEQEGLPAGLSKHDMVRLLYTFNYTTSFQGHFEEGYSNGVKKGYYFVTGRNGIRMRIDYVADDTGFHPKVSQDVLDLLSEDVPKPETERDEKYGLKGYEFKWLYYPVDSKRR